MHAPPRLNPDPSAPDMDPRPRILGDYDQGHDGPLLIAIGALHGNETAGVHAIERVLRGFEARRPRMRGRFLGIVGHRRAFGLGRRFVNRDLNRNWSPQALSELRPEGAAEDREQRELLDLLEPLLASAMQPIIFIDLHSSSGPSIPFVCASDVLRNRKIAFALGLPVVLGLEEVIEGSFLGFLCDHGHVGVAVEGGRHEDPATIENHVAALQIALVQGGLLRAEDVPDLSSCRRRLLRARGKVPRVLEIVHRHVIGPDDDFVMNPGWRSFAPVSRGRVVARDRNGLISSPCDGVMLLPRYQGQGDDGYFVAGPVHRIWLRVSTLARKLRLDRALKVLPGVDGDPERTDALVAQGLAAQWLSPNVFHLFGYRRSRSSANGRVFMRRQPDEVGLRPGPSHRRRAR